MFNKETKFTKHDPLLAHRPTLLSALCKNKPIKIKCTESNLSCSSFTFPVMRKPYFLNDFDFTFPNYSFGFYQNKKKIKIKILWSASSQRPFEERDHTKNQI